MKKKRHSPEQIIRKLREAEGLLSAGKTIAEVCRQLEINEQTFHRFASPVGRGGCCDCTLACASGWCGQASAVGNGVTQSTSDHGGRTLHEHCGATVPAVELPVRWRRHRHGSRTPGCFVNGSGQRRGRRRWKRRRPRR